MAISRAHLLVPVNVAGPLPAVGVLAVGDVVVGHPAPAAALVTTLQPGNIATSTAEEAYSLQTSNSHLDILSDLKNIFTL